MAMIGSIGAAMFSDLSFVPKTKAEIDSLVRDKAGFAGVFVASAGAITFTVSALALGKDLTFTVSGNTAAWNAMVNDATIPVIVTNAGDASALANDQMLVLKKTGATTGQLLNSDGSLALVDATSTVTTLVFTSVSSAINRIKNVREFPAMGTPANIVNVPTYGQKTSQTIQGQADAPQLEITINYVAADWDAGDNTKLGKYIGDGLQKVFRFTLLQEDPGVASYVSSMAGFGGKDHACYYWIGKMEALQVTPNLTDATTATLTLSAQSDFYGAFTHA